MSKKVGKKKDTRGRGKAQTGPSNQGGDRKPEEEVKETKDSPTKDGRGTSQPKTASAKQYVAKKKQHYKYTPAAILEIYKELDQQNELFHDSFMNQKACMDVI
jgi:hypothetical protein